MKSYYNKEKSYIVFPISSLLIVTIKLTEMQVPVTTLLQRHAVCRDEVHPSLFINILK